LKIGNWKLQKRRKRVKGAGGARSDPQIRSNRIRVLISVILASGAVLCFFRFHSFVYRSDDFGISTVSVVGIQPTGRYDEFAYSGISKGNNLFLISPGVLRSRILALHPELKEVVVRKSFPNSLIVTVKTRLPYAQINKEPWFAIDRDGFVLSKNNQPFAGLVVVTLPEDATQVIVNRLYAGKELQKALLLIGEIKASAISSQYRLAGVNARYLRSMSFYLEGLPEIKIGDENYRARLALLQETLRSGGRPEKTRWIDLRFGSVIYKRLE
jgi:cell division septal protein FtsQ